MTEVLCSIDGKIQVVAEDRQDKISYKQFMRLPDEDIKIGMRVGPLTPSKLYVSQDWTDNGKFGTAIEAFNSVAGTLVIPVYIHQLRFQNGATHRATVIADCHHRALVWAVNGGRIEGDIVRTSLPEHLRNSNVMPFSKFRRSYEPELLRLKY